MSMYRLFEAVPSLKKEAIRRGVYERILQGSVEIYRATTTPEENKILVSKEFHLNNRDIIKANLKSLEEQMAAGCFDVPEAKVLVDAQGMIRSAKHRFTASVNKNVAITQDYAFNVTESEVLRGTNEGKQQNNATRINNLGFSYSSKDGKKVAEIVNSINDMLYGVHNRLVLETLGNTIETFREGIDFVLTLKGSTVYRQTKALLAPLAIAYPTNPQAVSTFAFQLNLDNPGGHWGVPFSKKVYQYIEGDANNNVGRIKADSSSRVRGMKIIHAIKRSLNNESDEGKNLVVCEDSLLYFLQHYAFYKNRIVKNSIPPLTSEVIPQDPERAVG